MSEDKLRTFLDELTRVCREHGIGLTDGAELYIMEQEDHARAFSANEQSELSFA